MDIHHKIKPIHGWREFFGEVGIIVLGVCIALTAEQVVERLHWRHEVKQARETIASELAEDFAVTKQRELLSHCIARRVRDIADILDEAQRTGRLPPVGDLGGPGGSMVGLPSWTSLGASGVAAHFPRDEQTAYGAIVDGGRGMTDLLTAEREDWARLYTIVGPGRSITSSELGELRAALSAAGSRAVLLRYFSVQLKEEIKSLGIPLDAEFVRRWPGAYAAMKKRTAAAHLCQPIGNAPDHYGVIPGGAALEVPPDQLK